MDNIDPRLFGNLSLTMMMSYKAIPDTMPFLFPEVADDIVLGWSGRFASHETNLENENGVPILPTDGSLIIW